MKAFFTHFSFEFRTGLRDKNQFLLNYLFPLGLYLLLGSLMTQLNPLFRESLIPVMIIIATLSSTILGLPNPLVSARESGVYRSYKINGVPAFSILAIPALTTLLHVLIVAIIITISAPLLFDAPLPSDWVAFVMVFLLTAFTCAGLGMLISVISSNTSATVLWSQLIFLPSMLIGGLMIPFGTLPDILGKIALLLPTTHSINAFQQLAWNMGTSFSPTGSWLILLASGILSVWLATFLFNWDTHNATRRGHPALALLVMLPYIVGLVLS
jgi:ABC-2 type transport system permease protein